MLQRGVAIRPTVRCGSICCCQLGADRVAKFWVTSPEGWCRLVSPSSVYAYRLGISLLRMAKGYAVRGKWHIKCRTSAHVPMPRFWSRVPLSASGSNRVPHKPLESSEDYV